MTCYNGAYQMKKAATRMSLGQSAQGRLWTATLNGLVAVAVSWVLSGCGEYYYNGKAYGSKEAVFAAQRELHERALAKIAPLQTPVADYALVGIPSREVLQERALTPRGRPSTRAWLVSTMVREYLFVVEAIERRGTFKKVVVRQTDGGHLTASPGVDAVYLSIPDPTAAGWYFKRHDAAAVPVFFDHGNPDMGGRVTHFVDMVTRLAAQR
jgi:hypothetical protein